MDAEIPAFSQVFHYYLQKDAARYEQGELARLLSLQPPAKIRPYFRWCFSSQW